MEIIEHIVVADDFSIHPGARYSADGDCSGEKFLNEILLPKFESAVTRGGILHIDLDRVFGYPSSFVSGSFGKLSTQKGASLVLKHIEFKSKDNKLRLERIIKEIQSPKKFTV
jgi:hypothetical protein